MKTIPFALILFLTALDLGAQTPPAKNVPMHRQPTVVRFNDTTNSVAPATPNAPVPAGSPTVPSTPGSLTSPNSPAIPASAAPNAGTSVVSPPAGAPEDTIPAGTINFQGVDVSQVLEVYAKLVGRTLLRAGLPTASIVLKTETPLTRTEAIEALQAVLALNGISVVNIGDKFVKVLPSTDANAAGAAFNSVDADHLPNMGSYVTHIVHLNYVKPSEIVPAVTPFAKLNSIIPLDSNGILILRDYAENVKRMLEVIAQVDVNVPAVYISEVIPIKYALAADINTALNSLGGGGGTVSIGTSTSSSGGGTQRGNGFGATGGTSGLGGGMNTIGQQPRAQGAATANGTPAAGNTFQSRLNSIIQRAAGTGGQQDQIQLFGQTKIVADERSNSLLVFATRTDMDTITNIIAKLDVLLSQVLIESIIMEVNLGSTLDTGVSAVQRASAINTPNFKGTGGYASGPAFFSFMTNGLSNVATNLTGGFSYFGQIGNSDYDVAIKAAASDNSISILQRPRIQTFQAQKATFFVGQTVPYVTGSTFGSAYGNSSSYAQLSVGVQLDVTPFINPDGLVVMEINEEIDNISGSTFIEGVGNVPNTDKRTLNSQVAVKDRDTIVLGGSIYSQKSKTKSGVPVLQDIPLLGMLFSARNTTKSRDELLVLIRPTVLKTPTLAADQARIEKERLPGIAHLEAQDIKDEATQLKAEETLMKLQEQKDAKKAAKDAARARKLGESSSTNTPPVQLDAAPTGGTNAAPFNPAAGL